MDSLMINPNSELSDQQSWSQPWSSQDKDSFHVTVAASEWGIHREVAEGSWWEC